jgi:hypothetical protein
MAIAVAIKSAGHLLVNLADDGQKVSARPNRFTDYYPEGRGGRRTPGHPDGLFVSFVSWSFFPQSGLNLAKAEKTAGC